ncbi:hypothetical protein H1R17_07910 [Flavobacterium sp. xlx-214]|uniref:hypothetical protein n=1 Tax=unclassified Flavobacterium TaxID=196869 RepID=UPI0013D3BCC4|nr:MULTISPECIES: hypothetical protein [unclassified Flavobacterium]MBA5792260.1 hypothetical protein [Flavobacterium sp. xlx-221]QMI82423.1 hypothetical protein H1R17_07910 [Flavobacterium sp. xlx-214]
MIKRSVYLYITFLLCQVIIISCCPSTKVFNFKLNTLTIKNADLTNEVLENGIVNKNNYRIKCIMDVNAIQIASFNANTIVSSAYAFTCDSDAYKGLESPIVKFEIKCSQSLFGIPANVPLDLNNFQVYKIGFNTDSKNIRYSVDDWLKILNEGKFNIAFEWYFECKKPITTEDNLQFYMTLELENGQIFQANTKPIKLQ